MNTYSLTTVEQSQFESAPVVLTWGNMIAALKEGGALPPNVTMTDQYAKLRYRNADTNHTLVTLATQAVRVWVKDQPDSVATCIDAYTFLVARSKLDDLMTSVRKDVKRAVADLIKRGSDDPLVRWCLEN